METGNNVLSSAIVQSTDKTILAELISHYDDLRMSVRLRPDGISFLLLSVSKKIVLYFRNYLLQEGPLVFKQMEEVIQQEQDVLKKVSRVNWSWAGRNFTLVPENLFDASISSLYLDYQGSNDKNGIHKLDSLSFVKAKLLYSIPDKYHQLFVRHSTGSVHFNMGSVVDYWLTHQKPGVSEVLLVLDSGYFYIALSANQELLLLNQFEFKSPEDLVYHLLFCMEQYHFNPERIPVIASGIIDEGDKNHKFLTKFIRNVKFSITVENFKPHEKIELLDRKIFHWLYPNICSII